MTAEHSASRRVDVLAAEAPELLAGEPRVAVVVFDTEADRPMPLGLFLRHDEDAVVYERPNGEVTWAPSDCVTVRRVSL